MQISEDIRVQLKRLDEWRDQSGATSSINLIDYVGFEASPEILIAIAFLLNPTIITYKGARFLEYRFDHSVCDEWLALGNPIRTVQEIMNQVRIRTLIQGEPISDEMAEFLARLVTDFWHLTIPSCKAFVAGKDFENYAATFTD
jgi:hypothetical protein